MRFQTFVHRPIESENRMLRKKFDASNDIVGKGSPDQGSVRESTHKELTNLRTGVDARTQSPEQAAETDIKRWRSDTFNKTREQLLSILTQRLVRAQKTAVEYASVSGTAASQQKDAIPKMQRMQNEIAMLSYDMDAQDKAGWEQAMDAMFAMRKELGLSPMPQDMYASYGESEKAWLESVAGRDKSLEVRWLEINEQLKRNELILTGMEHALKMADTAIEIALSKTLLGYGDIYYILVRNLADAASGAKTPEQALRDFVVSALLSRIGMKKMPPSMEATTSKLMKAYGPYFTKSASAMLSNRLKQGAIEAGKGIAEDTVAGMTNAAVGMQQKKSVGETLKDATIRGITGTVIKKTK